MINVILEVGYPSWPSQKLDKTMIKIPVKMTSKNKKALEQLRTDTDVLGAGDLRKPQKNKLVKFRKKSS